MTCEACLNEEARLFWEGVVRLESRDGEQQHCRYLAGSDGGGG